MLLSPTGDDSAADVRVIDPDDESEMLESGPPACFSADELNRKGNDLPAGDEMTLFSSSCSKEKRSFFSGVSGEGRRRLLYSF